MTALPALTDSGGRLYDACASLATQDADNGFVTLILCAAFAAMVDPVANIVRDPDEGDTTAVPGWAKIFDVDSADASWLPWVGQFVGADLTSVPDAASQRSLIKNPIGYQRGSADAMVQFAQATLTGTRTVLVTERVGGNAWRLNISTYGTETPNPSLTLQALMSMKPAGLILNYTVPVSAATYAQLAASHTTYSAMEAAHTTYSDLPLHPSA